MNKQKEKKIKEIRRHRRVRAKIFGTSKIPRLNVFRSSKHIYGQFIDDEKGVTLLSVNDLNKELSKKYPAAKRKDDGALKRKINIALEVGKLLSQKAKEKGINRAVFDRGGYKYHGRIKALADGVREGGLKL